METLDYIPISYLNQLVYCPRRFWLMFIQNEMDINAPVLDGILRHRRAHEAGEQKDEHGRSLRSVHIWSNQYRIAGFADFVEEKDASLIPVEHKRGRMGKWMNDHIQLCAQALCLEERTDSTVPYGEIFYWGNRRREEVIFDDDLRDKTITVIEHAFELIEADIFPIPIDHPAKCRDCSLESICLPRETLMLLKEEAAI